MRFFLSSTLLTTSLALSGMAHASSSSKFESSITAPAPQAVKIEVVVSEDMAHRANHLPRDISDRASGVSSMNNGFANNGFYGEREIDYLKESFAERLTKRLTKEGVRVDETADTILRVTIVDAKPNRPTFGQLSKSAGLSYKSFGIGGAEIEGELIAAGGESLGTMSYAWYESHIRDAQFDSTWSDAKRAFSRFARKAADDLAY